MTVSNAGWLLRGSGRTPQLGWALAADAEVVAVGTILENRSCLAADVAGGLYLINDTGALRFSYQCRKPVLAMAVPGAASGVTAVAHGSCIELFNSHLEPEAVLELPQPPLAIAVNGHGEYVAAALPDGTTFVLDHTGATVAEFRAERALNQLRFLNAQAGLVGSSDFGRLYGYTMQGTQTFRENLPIAAKDLAVSGDDARILCACLAMGLPCYTSEGNHLGAFQVAGTVMRCAVGRTARKLAISTQENELFWLSGDGEVIWSGPVPGGIAGLAIDASETALYVAFEAGHVIQLVFSGS